MAIARALANKPKLILADEPTASLDTVRGKKVMEIPKKSPESRMELLNRKTSHHNQGSLFSVPSHAGTTTRHSAE